MNIKYANKFWVGLHHWRGSEINGNFMGTYELQWFEQLYSLNNLAVMKPSLFVGAMHPENVKCLS